MRKKDWVVGIFIFSMLASACVSTSTLRTINYEQMRLQDEVYEFYNAWRDKNSEKIWQLSSPFIKKENRKEEYIADADLFLKPMTNFSYSNLIVVYISKKLAVTQMNMSTTFKGESNFDDCERIVWLRFPEGWRFQEFNGDCSYMPDDKRMESLTKNVPDS